MNSKILLLALSVAAFSSCTTAYKTGQTPDDVYFSPNRAEQAEEYVRTEKENDRRRYNNDEYYDDRYLRMKVSSRYRWNDLNDWYGYERYSSGYNYVYGNYYNPYNSWNYYYNPYCNGTVISSYKNNVAYNKPRTFNLNTYNTTTTNSNRNSSMYKYTGSNNSNNNTYTAPRNSTRNSNNSNSGNILRDIFNSNSNNNSSSSSSSSGKSNTSSSSSSGSSSSSSGSSGSSAPVRRF